MLTKTTLDNVADTKGAPCLHGACSYYVKPAHSKHVLYSITDSDQNITAVVNQDMGRFTAACRAALASAHMQLPTSSAMCNAIHGKSMHIQMFPMLCTVRLERYAVAASNNSTAGGSSLAAHTAPSRMAGKATHGCRQHWHCSWVLVAPCSLLLLLRLLPLLLLLLHLLLH